MPLRAEYARRAVGGRVFVGGGEVCAGVVEQERHAVRQVRRHHPCDTCPPSITARAPPHNGALASPWASTAGGAGRVGRLHRSLQVGNTVVQNNSVFAVRFIRKARAGGGGFRAGAAGGRPRAHPWRRASRRPRRAARCPHRARAPWPREPTDTVSPTYDCKAVQHGRGPVHLCRAPRRRTPARGSARAPWRHTARLSPAPMRHAAPVQTFKSSIQK